MALARKPFVVIDAEILSSSVWSESMHVKLVWLTLLILCDTEGYVGAAIPGIARAAGVSLDQTREALSRLMLPDPDSRTQAHDGRRLQPVERGFQILNFRDHLDRLSKERAKSRDRVRRFRAKQRSDRDGNVTVTAGSREQGIGNRDENEERRSVSLTASVVEGGAGGRVEERRRLVEANPKQQGESVEAHRARIDALLG